MLSIEDCRRCLGKTSLNLCDSDIFELRELFYVSAEIFIDNIKRAVKPVMKVFVEIDEGFFISEELYINGAASIKNISNDYLLRGHEI